MDIKSLRPKDKAGKKKMPKILKTVLIILLIAFVGFGIYAELSNLGYIKTFQLAWQIQHQQQLSAEDKAILAQLKKIMVLPDDVTPTMAVITDIDALKKQQPTFFANAKNDDRLIIYPEQAIIFDAAANKIIKVGPVQINQATQIQSENFAIYNSLKDDPNNLQTTAMEAKIKAAFGNAVVSVKANSAKSDYPKTLVIDIAGNNPDIQKIADALGGQISGLPVGEKKPEGVAVLVIIGKE
ncbi:MAG: hypothetical protein WC460_00510 [Patescibacteria group bacterium]